MRNFALNKIKLNKRRTIYEIYCNHLSGLGWMFVVECPSIPGCVSQGKTEQEAIENIKDTIIIALKHEPNEVCLLLLVHVK